MLIPFVLSGGSGVRLWPLSRAAYPKQFCELLDESLLAKTLKRVQKLGGAPWTLTTKDLGALTARTYRELALPPAQILCEPVGRNTAPAIAYICRILQMRGLGDEIVGIFPADHLIGDESAFKAAVELAVECAQDGLVATLGIRPTRPATGFGYIEIEPARCLRSRGLASAFAVGGFREKPNEAAAREFFAQRKFLWNAGIFVFRVDAMAQNFAKLMPEMWSACLDLKPDLSNVAEIYARMPAISVDYAIMEKLEQQACVPCDPAWSDLGSWDDVAEIAEGASRDLLANRAHTSAIDAPRSFVFSSVKKTYALVGLEDAIIVDTPDAMLAIRRGSAQRTREAVELVKAASPGIDQQHLFEMRPWGGFAILRDEPHYKSKHIFVMPGQRISYQSHAKRAEHWIVVKGCGEVILDERSIKVEPGSAIFIPTGAKHRVTCTSHENLEFIEVQTGAYFGEDDIVRYSDDYNRA